jgi:hypothetical protein
MMTATSFGGSFDLVRNNSPVLRDLIEKQLFRNIVHGFIPFLKYVPLAPPEQVTEMKTLLIDIVAKRKREIESGKEIKRDLLQVSSIQFLSLCWY